jgi:hypothetical protein
MVKKHSNAKLQCDMRNTSSKTVVFHDIITVKQLYVNMKGLKKNGNQ